MENGDLIEHLSAGAVVVRRDSPPKYLLIKAEKQNGTFWGFPKGHVRGGESLLNTAIRETFEETGVAQIALKPLCYLGRIRYEFFTYLNGRRVLNSKEVEFFLLEAVGELTPMKVARDEFILELDWLTFENALELATFDNYRRILEMAKIAFLGERVEPNTGLLG